MGSATQGEDSRVEAPRSRPFLASNADLVMNTQVRDFRPFPLGINFNIAVVLHAGEAIVAAQAGMCRVALLAGWDRPGSAPRRAPRPCDAPEMSVRRSSAEIHSRPGPGRTRRLSFRVLYRPRPASGPAPPGAAPPRAADNRDAPTRAVPRQILTRIVGVSAKTVPVTVTLPGPQQHHHHH